MHMLALHLNRYGQPGTRDSSWKELTEAALSNQRMRLHRNGGLKAWHLDRVLSEASGVIVQRWEL